MKHRERRLENDLLQADLGRRGMAVRDKLSPIHTASTPCKRVSWPRVCRNASRQHARTVGPGGGGGRFESVLLVSYSNVLVPATLSCSYSVFLSAHSKYAFCYSRCATCAGGFVHCCWRRNAVSTTSTTPFLPPPPSTRSTFSARTLGFDTCKRDESVWLHRLARPVRARLRRRLSFSLFL